MQAHDGSSEEIRHLLELDRWPDLIVGPNGYAAKRRPDVAPFAYEVKINKPLGAEVLEKIVAFANGADPIMTRRLYSLCNGIRIGATKFGVYGVLGQIDRTSKDDAFHPPLDINVPNLYGKPDGWPDDHLIVGFSTEPVESGARQERTHAITPYGSVVVTKTDNAMERYREYSSVEAWLISEIDRALVDDHEF